jgi:translation initiation factor IF-3
MRRTHRRPKTYEPKKKFRFNYGINAPIVVLIDEEGTHHGEIEIAKAIIMAKEAELDLVEVNPTSNPPMVKIMDFGQFKYELDKKAQKQKTHHKKVDTKGIRLSIRIGEHDLGVRREQAKKFLAKGNKLRIELPLRGRERQHPELARDVINKFVANLEADPEVSIVVEEGLTSQGGKFTMLLTSKKP